MKTAPGEPVQTRKEQQGPPGPGLEMDLIMVGLRVFIRDKDTFRKPSLMWIFECLMLTTQAVYRRVWDEEHPVIGAD